MRVLCKRPPELPIETGSYPIGFVDESKKINFDRVVSDQDFAATFDLRKENANQSLSPIEATLISKKISGLT